VLILYIPLTLGLSKAKIKSYWSCFKRLNNSLTNSLHWGNVRVSEFLIALTTRIVLDVVSAFIQTLPFNPTAISKGTRSPRASRIGLLAWNKLPGKQASTENTWQGQLMYLRANPREHWKINPSLSSPNPSALPLGDMHSISGSMSLFANDIRAYTKLFTWWQRPRSRTQTSRNGGSLPRY
jgi:hypothetical protein